MAHFTRQSPYELAWSKPTRTVAAEIGVSDVWVAKTCRGANIPVPERGYRARKQAHSAGADLRGGLEHRSDIAVRISKIVGKVACPRYIAQPHKVISNLLESDAKRREEYPFNDRGFDYAVDLELGFRALVGEVRFAQIELPFDSAARLVL
jgi:hypothetical protein